MCDVRDDVEQQRRSLRHLARPRDLLLYCVHIHAQHRTLHGVQCSCSTFTVPIDAGPAVASVSMRVPLPSSLDRLQRGGPANTSKDESGPRLLNTEAVRPLKTENETFVYPLQHRLVCSRMRNTRAPLSVVGIATTVPHMTSTRVSCRVPASRHIRAPVPDT